ncbi:MAG TPA: efflux RND transporter periplasmic adaptor subunit [Vicinamibacterales bacterium]|nr:efflux RND transporter periplasmic adaptor subunit [Vicinamibacterales bacterium]
MKRRIAIIVIAILAVTASLAAYYRGNGSTDAPKYTTAVAVRGDVVEAVHATGTLGAVMTVQVGSQVSGTIKSLHADFNSIVRKGQVIARLDSSLFQAQVDQAEATIARLQADVERARVSLEDAIVKRDRARELSSRGLIPAAELETAETTVRQAQASVSAAQAQVTQARAALNQNRVNLSHTVITSPVDGIVISRNVDVGQTVAASMSAPTLFVIANDLTDMQVEASVDEADVGRIAAGQPVTFTVDAYPRDTFTGMVSQVRLQPVVQQNVVSYVTVIDVPNPEGKLKPGMTASVTIEVARAEDVLKVPNAALRFQPPQARPAAAQQSDGARGRRVWTLKDGQLQPILVRLGITDGTTTAIVGGDLAEQTPVVTGMTTSTVAPAASASSPLMPQRPGGNRQGGAARGGG